MLDHTERRPVGSNYGSLIRKRPPVQGFRRRYPCPGLYSDHDRHIVRLARAAQGVSSRRQLPSQA